MTFYEDNILSFLLGPINILWLEYLSNQTTAEFTNLYLMFSTPKTKGNINTLYIAWLYIFLEFIYLKCSIVSIYEDVNISLLSLGIAIQVRPGGTLWHGPQQDQVKDNSVRNVEK